MKRRQFLRGAGTVGAVTLLPVVASAASPATYSRFTLLRSATRQAGARFVPHDSCAANACDTAALRVRIDGLQTAEGGAVLHELWLSALFAAADGSTSPFVAWQFAQGPRPHMGQRLSFVAPRDRLRGFALDYRLQAASACEHETCSLTSFALPLLTPGHYALLGPRRDGRAAPTLGLRHSGDLAAPLVAATARDFDCLAFRIDKA